MDLGIAIGEMGEGVVGENDSPPEGVERAVALDHGDVVPRIELLHQDRVVQPGRPAADARDPHRRGPIGGPAGLNALKPINVSVLRMPGRLWIFSDTNRPTS